MSSTSKFNNSAIVRSCTKFSSEIMPKLAASLCLLGLSIPMELHQTVFAADSKDGKNESIELELRTPIDKNDSKSARPSPEERELPEQELKKLLDRIAPLPVASPAVSLPAPVKSSAPRPESARTEDVKLPAAPAELKQNGPELRVLDYGPFGQIDMTDKGVIVKFSEPMVAIGEGQTKIEDEPVSLEPRPKGSWRWLDDRSIIFEPKDGKWPGATKFTARVKDGLAALSGNRLKAALTWSFSTPSLAFSIEQPNVYHVGNDRILPLLFNQAVDPVEILNHIQIKAKGNAKIHYSVIGKQSLKQDEGSALIAVLDRLPPNNYVLLKLENSSAQMDLTLLKSSPAVDGPLLSVRDQRVPIRDTFDKLRLVRSQEIPYFELKDGKVIRKQRLELDFTQWLQPVADPASLIRISPEVPNLKVQIQNQTISLKGDFSENAKYRVTVSGDTKCLYTASRLGQPVIISYFEERPLSPAIWLKSGDFISLNSRAGDKFKFWSSGFREITVKAFAMKPHDYEAYVDASNDGKAFRRTQIGGSLESNANESPGASKLSRLLNSRRLLFSKKLEASLPYETPRLNELDLSPYLKDSTNDIVLVFEGNHLPKDPPQSYQGHCWVQSSADLNVSWWNDGKSVLVQAADRDGNPINALKVSFPHAASTVAETGADGICKLATSPVGESSILFDYNGRTLLFPFSTYYSTESRGTAIHVVTDREYYQPGETVSFKGWVRQLSDGAMGGLAMPNFENKEIEFQVNNADSLQLGKVKAKIDKYGSFSGSYTIPQDVGLGYVQFESKIDPLTGDVGSNFGFHVIVREFRIPEFQVELRKASSAEQLAAGSKMSFRATAKYYSGGPLSGSNCTWSVKAYPISFTPPGWASFNFSNSCNGIKENQKTLPATTDKQGESVLLVEPKTRFLGPIQLHAVASIQDLNRQTYSASCDEILHRAELYVGLKPETASSKPGEDWHGKLIVTDIRGQVRAGYPVEFTLKRRVKPNIANDAEFETVKVWQLMSRTEPVDYSVKTSQQGSYVLSAEVKDRDGRANATEFGFESGLSVPIAKDAVDSSKPAKDEKKDFLRLILDKKIYEVGDLAHLTVQSSFQNALGMLVLKKRGIVSYQPFKLSNHMSKLEFPILRQYDMNLVAGVALTTNSESSSQLTDSELAALDTACGENCQVEELTKQNTQAFNDQYQSADIVAPISLESSKLSVTVEPDNSTKAPGDEVRLSLSVMDHEKHAVSNAELSVFVVDESVVNLSSRPIFSNPLDSFHQRYRLSSIAAQNSSVYRLQDDANEFMGEDAYFRATRTWPYDRYIGGGRLARPMLMGAAIGAVAGKSYGSFAPAPVHVARPRRIDSSGDRFQVLRAYQDLSDDSLTIFRKNFNPLASFEPAVITGADGKATMSFKLPDTITKYKIVAFAADMDNRFGVSESAVTASQPLMIRPAPPRFLHVGDHFEFPVLLQNQSASELNARIAFRSTLGGLQNGIGKEVKVPANDRVEVQVPATADASGPAPFQVIATAEANSKSYSDSVENSIPVILPSSSIGYATHGVIDGNETVRHKFDLPENILPESGGLEFSASSSRMHELKSAEQYMQNYQYECTEQLSSRVLSLSAAQALRSKQGTKVGADSTDDAITTCIKMLERRQTVQGGFGLWDNQTPLSYLSVYATYALVMANQNGYAVSAECLDKAKSYIKNPVPASMDRSLALSIQAYALYVRSLQGDDVLDDARRLLGRARNDGLSDEGMAWLLPIFSGQDDGAFQTLSTRLHNQLKETAAGASLESSGYGNNNYAVFHSKLRDDAVFLMALVQSNPQDPAIVKLANGLLAARVNGKWRNTQEDAFASLALLRYLSVAENVPPDFKVDKWIGEISLGEDKFNGRNSDEVVTRVSTQFLMDHPADRDFLVSKEGAGRLYYRLGMKFYPKDLIRDAVNSGFVVKRVYEPVNEADKDGITYDCNNGIWHIRAGTVVRVRLIISNQSERYNIALVDPLPSGLESINSDLKGSLKPNLENTTGRGFADYWYDHVNLRKDRTEVFASEMAANTYSYDYAAIATTRGRFFVPPAKVEEMYAPETFGCSASDVVVVE